MNALRKQKVIYDRGINFMDDMKGHLSAMNNVFKLEDGIPRRREDMPVITQSRMELYECNRFNNDVGDELTEVWELLRFIHSVVHKHKGHNYQPKLSIILQRMGDKLDRALDDVGELVAEVEDRLSPADLMTINELQDRGNERDPDAAYDDYRNENDNTQRRGFDDQELDYA